MHALDRLEQAVAIERLRQPFEIAVTGLLQQFDGGIVDTFQEQNLDAVLRKGKAFAGAGHDDALTEERLL